MIAGAIPRFLDFHMEDTPIMMKKKIYEHVEDIFKTGKAPTDDEEERENWINKMINIQIKDNTPYISSSTGYTKRKAECEFCGRRHN